MLETAFDSDATFPRLNSAQLAVLDAVGQRRQLTAGQILFQPGQVDYDLNVIVRGTVAVIDGHRTATERVLTTQGAGRFLGELSVMTGEPAYLAAVVQEPGEAMLLGRQALERVIAREPHLGDVILGALVARRAALVDNGSGVRVIGTETDENTRRLRIFLTRNQVPHTFLDLAEDGGAVLAVSERALAVAGMPTLVHGSILLRNPSNVEVADALNLRHRKTSTAPWDTVVVGGGPAGLAAAVYGASEGLETILIDGVSLGGQASTSSRIENYLGFPAGISGADLAGRAAVQARRLGARTAVPERARRLTLDADGYLLELDSGDELRTRTVVLATGATYSRLDVERIAELEGAGVYYAATAVEARTCDGRPVAVVGGGNSAGQAAVFLASRGSRVSLLLRGGDIPAGMSQYLVDQVQQDPSIEVLLYTEIRALHGEEHLDGLTVEQTQTGASSHMALAAAFIFIGASPHTDWLGEEVAKDSRGFILTGSQLRQGEFQDERGPLLLETSLPGVFAVGDARSGSLKRVASAVGEGAMAVRLIHEHLSSLGLVAGAKEVASR